MQPNVFTLAPQSGANTIRTANLCVPAHAKPPWPKQHQVMAAGTNKGYSLAQARKNPRTLTATLQPMHPQEFQIDVGSGPGSESDTGWNRTGQVVAAHVAARKVGTNIRATLPGIKFLRGFNDIVRQCFNTNAGTHTHGSSTLSLHTRTVRSRFG